MKNLPRDRFDHHMGSSIGGLSGTEFESCELDDNFAPDFTVDGRTYHFQNSVWETYPSGARELLGWEFKTRDGQPAFISNE